MRTGCRKCKPNDPCSSWCAARCRRKKRFATYAQAKELRDELKRRRLDGDPTLGVYHCEMGDHYHLGHATGARAQQLLKRAEKQRRKALVRSLSPVVEPAAAMTSFASSLGGFLLQDKNSANENKAGNRGQS